MLSTKTTARARVWGTKNVWSLSPFRTGEEPKQECDVELEIQGDDRYGYHLVMSPDGFFTADSWHQTKQDALETAMELFDVRPTIGRAHVEWMETSEQSGERERRIGRILKSKVPGRRRVTLDVTFDVSAEFSAN